MIFNCLTERVKARTKVNTYIMHISTSDIEMLCWSTLKTLVSCDSIRFYRFCVFINTGWPTFCILQDPVFACTIQGESDTNLFVRSYSSEIITKIYMGHNSTRKNQDPRKIFYPILLLVFMFQHSGPWLRKCGKIFSKHVSIFHLNMIDDRTTMWRPRHLRDSTSD